jgi:2,5-dioxopentanoate dehydrogenase
MSLPRQEVEPAYSYGDASDVNAACSAAAAAFAEYRSTTSEQRARFLEAIAANIEAVTAVFTTMV